MFLHGAEHSLTCETQDNHSRQFSDSINAIVYVTKIDGFSLLNEDANIKE